MRQLTALDTQFLSAESHTTTSHVAGVAILDPACAPTGTVTREGLINLLRERIHLAPPLRMRLADVPFALDRPYWVEDADLDLREHVYESTLPAPGDDDQLAEHVSRIHARRLDRRRPLWEMHLIQGLPDGRVALYTKVHHCAIDGVSGAEILVSLLDLSPEPRLVETPPEVPAERTPEQIGLLAGGLARSVVHPLAALRSFTRAVADLDAIPLASALPGARLIARATRRLLGDERPRPELPPLAAPRTPFNGVISGERSFAFGSIPLEEIRRVSRTFGMSVNDVVMTLCASALRRWLISCDALPGQPLIAAVPVAVRTARGSETIGNQISAMITPLATNVECPKERLSTVRSAMLAAKRRFAVSPATWLNDVCAMFPAPFSALATPTLFRLAGMVGTGVNLIVSNVPGPPFPLYLCGARVLSYYPMSVVTDVTGALSITCISYDGRLDLGVVACPARVPDVWSLIGHIDEAMEELTTLAKRERAAELESAAMESETPGPEERGTAEGAGRATPDAGSAQPDTVEKIPA
ncbi:wax ester/triacylglycerol synthase family O-acyltransferase [Microtetraspora fusca]|uniref:Diacylglycerol O-acyltransferase n=1 Tax=Microtetraspora fusca TaxID=1997 RepID=A0ABW6V598_MICFU